MNTREEKLEAVKKFRSESVEGLTPQYIMKTFKTAVDEFTRGFRDFRSAELTRDEAKSLRSNLRSAKWAATDFLTSIKGALEILDRLELKNPEEFWDTDTEDLED